MLVRRIVCSALTIAAAVAVLSSQARAQYYSACPANPLAWPFCIAGAAVGTAAAIATVPLQAVAGVPYYYYPEPYYAPVYYRHPVHHHPHKKPQPVQQ
jgi:hypothetical protein